MSDKNTQCLDCELLNCIYNIRNRVSDERSENRRVMREEIREYTLLSLSIIKLEKQKNRENERHR